MYNQNQDEEGGNEEKERRSKRHRMEFDFTMMESDLGDKKRRKTQLEMDILRLNKQKFQIEDTIKSKEYEIKNIEQELITDEDKVQRARKKINELRN